MSGKPITLDDAHRLLDRLAELDRNDGLTEPWRIEQIPHDYPDRTTHFTHVRTTGYVQDEPVLVSIGTYLTPATAELLVTLRNNLPELIRLARLGLEAERDVASNVFGKS
jgi:hypothetical protein